MVTLVTIMIKRSAFLDFTNLLFCISVRTVQNLSLLEFVKISATNLKFPLRSTIAERQLPTPDTQTFLTISVKEKEKKRLRCSNAFIRRRNFMNLHKVTYWLYLLGKKFIFKRKTLRFSTISIFFLLRIFLILFLEGTFFLFIYLFLSQPIHYISWPRQIAKLYSIPVSRRTLICISLALTNKPLFYLLPHQKTISYFYMQSGVIIALIGITLKRRFII